MAENGYERGLGCDMLAKRVRKESKSFLDGDLGLDRTMVKG